jgi:hypothetical protein
MLIRPAFRYGTFMGYSLHNGVEPIGKVYSQYKLAVLALRGVQS